MAELTGPKSQGAGTAPVDPRSVRVRVVDAVDDGRALRVAPAPEPLRMTNPSVGIGLLGGAAMGPPPEEPPTVLAQRQVIVDGERADVSIHPLGGGRHRLEVAGASTRVVLEEEMVGEGGTRVREVLVGGFRVQVVTESERIASLRERATRGRGAAGQAGPLQIKAIIPGKVVAVSVKPGDQVEAGQQLLVVEAMKMQNELRAPRDGTIERVGVTVGVNIEIGDLLVVIS